MSGDELDISGSLAWEDGLPRPQWDLIEELVESRCERDARRNAWIAVVLQWLAELGPALGGGYETVESAHFLVLAPEVDATGRPVLRIAERCRVALLSVLGGVVNFEGHGKSVVLVLRTRGDYYRYISLYHLSMPQWLEEGLAQMFEHDVTGSSPLEVDAEMARRQKRYWGRCGLDGFWRGEVFSRRGKVQELSYQLAEILVRLLVEEGRPRWFGRVREPQRRLLAFLREASMSDCGEAACREHLGVALSDLAARFLGPGSWSPGPCPGLA
jgi:hypothetical protein